MPKFSVLRMAGSEIIRTMGAMLLIILVGSQILDAGAVMTGGCRTFCGNITVDYPFGIEQGCGHPKYRDLVYCINNVMMFHVISGSYEVVNIDYGFKVLDIFDPKMSTCASMHKSDGFFLEEARSRYLQPTPDNAFMLLGCSKASPLFEGFPDKHLPCRNVTGMGCDAFYDCPSWVGFGKKSRATRPPPCCGIPYSSIGSLNLSRLQCYSYATVYNRAPIKVANPYTSIAPAFLSLYVQEEVKGKEHGFGDGQHGENEDRRHLFDERHGGNEGEQGLFDAQLGRNEEKIGSQVENGECVEKGARVRPSRRGAKAKENKNDAVSPFVGRITRARGRRIARFFSARRKIFVRREQLCDLGSLGEGGKMRVPRAPAGLRSLKSL